jgi:hypothetical protein
LIDEMDLDVVPLDICGIVLGSPYLYDRKVVFFHHENKYHLTKGGVEYIVISHKMRVNTTLVSVGKMKRLIKNNKRYVLMVVREKDVGTSNAFQGCDPSHKKDYLILFPNMMLFFKNHMDYLLRWKSNMRNIFNRILLFLMWACTGCQLWI